MWGPRVECDMSGEGFGGSHNYEEFVSEKMADEAEKMVKFAGCL